MHAKIADAFRRHYSPFIPEDTSVLLFSIAKELLFNTVKHSGQLHAKITLSKTEDESIRMVVQDNGKGFALRESEYAKSEGFGLFNIRNRLEMLKGVFSINSSPPNGSEITIDLPVKWAEPENLTAVMIQTAPGTPYQAVARELNGKIRVLLVDNHKIVRNGLKALLECESDMEIIGEAVDGIDAVEKAESLRPDVILMDISMPRMNGIEATKKIISSIPDMKIVALTLHEAEYIAPRMMDAGAVGYVTKDCSAEELYAAIRKFS